MVKKLTVLAVFIAVNLLNAQVFTDGYFTETKKVSDGIIATDDFQSSLYLIKGNSYEKIISSPGIGRYFTTSADNNLIGFKYIDHETGMQKPAVLDLANRSVNYLATESSEAGQVSFADNNTICFTSGTDLIIRKNGTNTTYNLGVYSNWTPISPSGNFIVYNDNDNQLWLFDLRNEERKMITNKQNGYFNARWSNDSKNIAFASLDGKIFNYAVENDEFVLAGEGQEPRWSDNGNSIYFYKKEIDFEKQELINSDIYKFDVSLNQLQQLTDTKDKFEMFPSEYEEGSVIFSLPAEKSLKKLDEIRLNKGSSEVLTKDLSTEVKIYNYKVDPAEAKSLSKKDDLDKWVHIHQVFDTRQYGSWTSDPVNGKHQGYRCCGAASAMEILASYRILPEWPMTTYGHVSEYGKYISDEYTHNDYTYKGFDIRSGAPGFKTGIHGYMWNNGSPYSNMVSFFKKHDVSSKRYDYPSWNRITNEFKEGYPYVLCTTQLTSAHIVVAIGQYGSGHSLYCNDPYGDKNAGSYGGKNNGKNAIYDWADANTGHEQISPVVWGITARFSPYLHLANSYPAVGDSLVACNSKIILYFDAAIKYGSIAKNIKLTDPFNNEIACEIDSSQADSKKIILIPESEFDYNSSYKVRILTGLTDQYDCNLEEETEITFKTEKDITYEGLLVSNFEEEERFDLTTYGTENDSTSFLTSEDVMKDGSASGKLSYYFTSSSNGYCRIIDNNEFEIPVSKDTSFGIWILGNAERHKLEIWFSDGTSSLIKGYSDAIDWSGWRFINFSTEALSDTKDKIWLNSIAIRQNSSADKKGVLYFDNALLFNTEDYFTDVQQISEIPNDFRLMQNFPNPFNPSTTISFSIPNSGNVKLSVFNALGEKIKTLLDGNYPMGVHQVRFNANSLSSGIYFYKLDLNSPKGNYSDIKKMILMK